MKRQKKSIIVFTMMLLSIAFFLGVNALGGESYYPPVPDKNKTLPANDGRADGCNSSRFKCVMGDEAVLDKQTGLTWARDANITNKAVPWQEAVTFCQGIEIAKRKGWRLPSREELITLLDTSQSDPALPDGHPFKNVQVTRNRYWSSTVYEGSSESAWVVSMYTGKVEDNLKLFDGWIWPVIGAK